MTRGRWQDRVRAVEQRTRSYQASPVCCPYKTRLSRAWQPSSVWTLFPRQDEAIAFSQRCTQDVHVFALEKEGSDAGQRIYLVTSYCELWHYYRSHRRSLMHCYEVIPDGAACKLYFDLEFHTASNTDLDGRKMVAALIRYVCEKLEDVYGLRCSSRDVLNLDSSTEGKFSRHLVFLLPGGAFKDNRHVGRFIHGILQPALNRLGRGSEATPLVRTAPEVGGHGDGPESKRMRPDQNHEEDLSFLIVKSKDGREQLFVDLGVYTRNRNFRLYKSSKLGKHAAFAVAEDNGFTPKPDRRTTEDERIFLASLITNISFTGQKILTYDIPERGSGGSPGSLQHEGAQSRALAGERQSSPYKELDDAVLKLVCKDGIQGSIRRWTYFVSDQLLVYDIGKFRWCHNVSRFHKSNNIMIVVDLKREVWYQRCHDPECREQNYRSSSFPLPQEVCMSYMLKEDEDDRAFLMDDLGNIESSPRRVPASLQKVQDSGGATSSPRIRVGPDGEEDDASLLEALDDDDDASFLEALNEVEKSIEEIPDELLIQALTECEAHSNNSNNNQTLK